MINGLENHQIMVASGSINGCKVKFGLDPGATQSILS
jgi:hypothetical protein